MTTATDAMRVEMVIGKTGKAAKLTDPAPQREDEKSIRGCVCSRERAIARCEHVSIVRAFGNVPSVEAVVPRQ